MHKIMCGDITKGDLAKLMDKPADVIYSDPPWDDTWVTLFRKKAGVELEGQTINSFLRIYISELKKYANGIVYIEMGSKSINLLLDLLKENGATQLNLWEYPYHKGKQYIWRGYFKPGNYKVLENVDFQALGGKVHSYLVNQDAIPGGVLLDPCIGIGRSYDLAVKTQMDCYGLEISKDKVERLLKRVK